MNAIVPWLFAISLSLIALTIIIKFVLWMQINSKRKIGFFKSFRIWYTLHDLHNTSSTKSHRFRSTNNILNVLFWLGFIVAIVAYIFNTNEVLDTAPKIPPKSFSK
jgi:Mg2+/citrate symporter